MTGSMNSLSTLSRVCARRTLAVRPSSTPPTKSHSSTNSIPQPRHLSTITAATAAATATDISTPESASPSSSSPSNPSSTANLSTASPFLLLGTVTRTGTMASTIQLTTPSQQFDRHLQKHYTRPRRLLAHSPFAADYLREGDVVEYGPWSPAESAAKEMKRKQLEDRLINEGKIRLRTRKGKERKLSEVGVKKRGPGWVVRRVVTPFGVGVEER